MIITERLILRPWREEDLAPYAELNADPRVRQFFPKLLNREESDAEVRRFQERYAREGFGLLAAEMAGEGVEEKAFIGFIGMQTMNFAVPSLPQPAVEIGWRLASRYWGRGLASEGARAVLEYAFNTVGLPQVVAITAAANTPSRRVMERIGMQHVPGLDFLHPHITPGSFLSPHVLYKAAKPV